MNFSIKDCLYSNNSIKVLNMIPEVSWASSALFYHIYPLGLCGAPIENDFISKPVNRLERVVSWIPHIKSMGCNALYLGPVFESDFHGYDTADYYLLDRRLGINDTLTELSRQLHENGIRLVLDTVFNHVGRNFHAFLDLKENGRSSVYADWFCSVNFEQDNAYGDGFSYEGWFDAYNLVKLNLENPEVKAYLFKVVAFWMDEFNIDGLRFDVAEIMDRGFLSELSQFVRSRNPECWLLGEVINGDYNLWVNEHTLDSATNYEAYKALYSSHNNNNYFEIGYTLNRQFGEPGVYKDLLLYNFVDNHDTSRIASILSNAAHIVPAYTIMFMIPGIPSIYYGSEWGIPGIKGEHSDDLLRPEIAVIPDLSDVAIYHFIRRLSVIRDLHEALQHGSYLELYVTSQQFIFQRQYLDDIVIVAVNSSAYPVPITMNLDKAHGTVFADQLDDGFSAQVNEGTLTIEEIPPYGARILTLA